MTGDRINAMDLKIQGGTENDGIWPFDHLRRFLKFLLQLLIADDLSSLRHLTDEFCQSTEDADDASFKYVGQLQRMSIQATRQPEGRGRAAHLADVRERSTSTPLYNDVHQLHFEGLDILGFIQR